MSERWITTDTHFGHKNIIKFTKPDGSPIRPGFYSDVANAKFTPFRDIEHHDESYIERFNSLVKPNHKVYFLGDFGKPLTIADRLHGKKRLILGNHDDVHDFADLALYFEQVLAWRVWRDDFAHPVVFTHFPLHGTTDFPVTRRINVHGHIHEKVITKPNGRLDPWYINVCVEHTNHAPLHWDELALEVKRRVSKLEQMGEIR